VTGAVSANGGSGGAGPSYTGGSGGQGRIKLLSSGDRSVTGTVSGARTDGLFPPLNIVSSSHPDTSLYYNDDAPGLSLAWDQAFAGRQGYYWGVNTSDSRPPTPANGGKVVAAEMITAPITSLTAGTNYFHIVPIDAMSNVGTVENTFKINVNTSPPSISSSSHPSSGTWYPSTDVMYGWTFPQDDKNFKGVYYVLDRYGDTKPEASTATFVPVTQKQLLRAGLANGIWVMHMVPIDQRGYLTKTAQHFRTNIGADPGKGGLLGQVVDAASQPVSGATVTINRGLWKVTTNAAGSYNFGSTIPVGTGIRGRLRIDVRVGADGRVIRRVERRIEGRIQSCVLLRLGIRPRVCRDNPLTIGTGRSRNGCQKEYAKGEPRPHTTEK